MKPSPDNTYALLAAFLSPYKTDRDRIILAELARTGRINWAHLLYQANTQLCTPVWYLSLVQDDLLTTLPEELQRYLEALTAANRERNQQLLAGLETLLVELNRREVTPVLLKGSAALAQQLHRDPGARILGDIDFLVEPHQSPLCEEILRDLGYREAPDPHREPDGLATDTRHHHINPYYLPGTPLVVEVHIKTTYAISAGVLPRERAMQDCLAVELGAGKARVMSPTNQLLLNTLHGNLPNRSFIGSTIELRQLLDFALIDFHFGASIDWDSWHQTANRHGLNTIFNTYRTLSVQLLGTDKAKPFKAGTRAQCHLARILTRGNLFRPPNESRGTSGRLATFALDLYYYLSLPTWIWRHPCYAPGWASTPDRLRMLLKKVATKEAWQKI